MYNPTASPVSLEGWYISDEMWGQSFRERRIGSLMKAYALGDSLNVVINSNSDVGRIRLEGQTLPFNRFSGVLFGYERVVAEPAEGYEFVGWHNRGGQLITRNRECPITEDGTYTAMYANAALGEGVAPICINEVSAGNDIYVNDYGKRSDWIELYNRGREPIDVSGLYFSDDAANPTKYGLSIAPGLSTVLRPDDHMVVWCDGRPSLTQAHLPFKLKNADNSTVSVCASDGSWADVFVYGAHSSRETVGRFPDGGKDSYVFYSPTIGVHNMTTMYDTAVQPLPNAVASPQPSSDDIVSVTYYTVDGREARPRNGVYVRVVLYRDGHSEAGPVLVKDGMPTY